MCFYYLSIYLSIYLFIYLAFSLMGEGHSYRFPQLLQALCSGGGDSPQHLLSPPKTFGNIAIFLSHDKFYLYRSTVLSIVLSK